MRIGAFFLRDFPWKETGQAEVIENVAGFALNYISIKTTEFLFPDADCTTETQTEITAGPSPSGDGFGDMSNWIDTPIVNMN